MAWKEKVLPRRAPRPVTRKTGPLWPWWVFGRHRGGVRTLAGRGLPPTGLSPPFLALSAPQELFPHHPTPHPVLLTQHASPSHFNSIVFCCLVCPTNYSSPLGTSQGTQPQSCADGHSDAMDQVLSSRPVMGEKTRAGGSLGPPTPAGNPKHATSRCSSFSARVTCDCLSPDPEGLCGFRSQP